MATAFHVQTPEVVNAQIKAISKRLAEGQSRVRECDAKFKRTLEETAETQWELTEAKRHVLQAQNLLRAAQEKHSAASSAVAGAQVQAESAQADLKRLNQALLPLRRPLEVAGSDTGSSSQTGTSDRNKRPRVEARQQQQPSTALQLPARHVQPMQYLSLPQPLVRPVVYVQSDSLGDLFKRMQENHGTPAEYDLQGLVMKYSTDRQPCISSHGITLRNGTIQLTTEQSLSVTSRDVTLHKVSVVGGDVGVVVAAGSSLSMTSCEIRDVQVGLMLTGNSALVASNLKVRASGHACLYLKQSSSADISDADFGGSALHAAIHISGTSSLVGSRLRFADTMIYAFFLRDASTASLEGCSLKSAPQRMIAVKDDASLLVKGCVDVDSLIDAKFIYMDSTAKVIVKNTQGIHHIHID